MLKSIQISIELQFFLIFFTISLIKAASINENLIEEAIDEKTFLNISDDSEVQPMMRADVSFSYDEHDTHGPSNWNLVNPTCGGSSQSPINIETSTVLKGTTPPLSMSYFKKPVQSITITNNGHSVNFRPQFFDSEPNRLLWNNGFSVQTFIFDSLHFHWGPSCGGGSEHTVNGHRYAAEVHLVHYNEQYGSLNDALSQPDGLAVVGVFFELAEESNNDGSRSNKFTKFLSSVKKAKQTFTITDSSGIFTIKELIKNEVKEYFSYKGSLTTPPCAESVRWIVSMRPVRIYPSELAQMAALFNEEGTEMKKNYRPTQKQNGRNIHGYRYSKLSF